MQRRAHLCNNPGETTPGNSMRGRPWAKGMSGNPAGRPSGSRNKISEMLLEDFAADWEQYGAEAIAECRRTDVATYVRLAASLIPKEFGVRVSTNPFSDLTDEQLAAVYASFGGIEAETHLLIGDQNLAPSLETVS